MFTDLQDRRISVCLAAVVDDALDLAEQCGWRYAIAYLVSEKVPSQVIQRLLSEGGRMRRRPSSAGRQTPLIWNGPNAHGMKNLFDSLRQRRSAEVGDRDQMECDSRFGKHYDEIG